LDCECYRPSERDRLVAILKAGSSALVVGGEGIGKTSLLRCVEQELQDYDYAVISPASAKVMLQNLASQLGVEAESLEGKSLKIAELEIAIAEHLSENACFILCDNAHLLSPATRRFLEQLHSIGVPMLLTATTPRPTDIFLKLPRIGLKPLGNKEIRAIALSHAQSLGLKLTPAKLSQIVARSGGTPMLARRAVDEEHLGLEPNYDHTAWVDGTPYLIVILLLLTLSRVIGRGTNNVTLAMIGMTLTIGVRIIQTLFYSLPKQSRRLSG
jgi:hypothetical protein